MNDPSTNSGQGQPSSEPEQTPDTATADTVVELEQMIKTNLATLDRNKVELKKLKEMLESTLLNDETYRSCAEKAKEAAKEKGKAKLTVLNVPTNKQLAEKIKNLSTQNRELLQAQSEYLREYARLSGTNEIEGEDGEIREIIYVAKLVKKAKR